MKVYNPAYGARVVFTLEKLKRLKRLYNKCTTETFMFEGNEYLKAYAKYLIQHLETLWRKK